MANLTDEQLRMIRAEVGSEPSDDDLQDLWDVLGSTTAVALAVLRPRLADARAAALAGGFTLSGVLGVVAPSSDTMRQLDMQISRLESQLAVESGTADLSGLATSSVIAGRSDRPR